MSIEETLGALLDARLAPLRSDVERMTAELDVLRKAIPPMLVPLREAAKRLGVSVETAKRRVKAGDWPARKDGNRILVDLCGLKPLSDEEVARSARRLRALPGGGNGHGET